MFIMMAELEDYNLSSLHVLRSILLAHDKIVY
jgi:hypothetical protein